MQTQSLRKSKSDRKGKSHGITNRRLFNIVQLNRRKTLAEMSTYFFYENTHQKRSNRRIQRRIHEDGHHRSCEKKTPPYI